MKENPIIKVKTDNGALYYSYDNARIIIQRIYDLGNITNTTNNPSDEEQGIHDICTSLIQIFEQDNNTSTPKIDGNIDGTVRYYSVDCFKHVLCKIYNVFYMLQLTTDCLHNLFVSPHCCDCDE